MKTMTEDKCTKERELLLALIRNEIRRWKAFMKDGPIESDDKLSMERMGLPVFDGDILCWYLNVPEDTTSRYFSEGDGRKGARAYCQHWINQMFDDAQEGKVDATHIYEELLGARQYALEQGWDEETGLFPVEEKK